MSLNVVPNVLLVLWLGSMAIRDTSSFQISEDVMSAHDARLTLSAVCGSRILGE
ncbi:hypothetical protein KC19_VG251400 [Ceratodon purpureus]|uniref:Uncharacterized protein n=1 Tax=Ceratodon purpureus TaxID=3225 RepID=A0A8T0HUT6_CERPU|nr:hypothetical protein KC19_VG251400 [Ceratodon purpureus]